LRRSTGLATPQAAQGEFDMPMKSMWCVPLVCLALMQPAGEEKVKKDLERMQGTWEMHALEINGKEVPAKQFDGTLLIVKGSEYKTKVKGKEIAGFQLKLDPSKNPKELDMIQKQPDGTEKVIKGIYTFENNHFKMCRGLDASQERPTQFATWPDTGYFVVTWKKQVK
jgi:uncharacterized protein (TIGR03067 family)